MPERIGLEATLDLGKWSGGVGKYLSDIDKMSGKTGGFASSVGSAFQNVGKIVLGATAAIAAAGIAAGAAIGKFAYDGIQSAADLEQQLSAIAATLNKTKAEVAPLNDLILKLGLDPNLVVTAEQAADAIENLARNGLSMDQILQGAARSTVLLANATGADFGQAADIATDVMAIFKIRAEDMDKAVNGITATTNISKFTIDDYALALAQGGGVAAAVGVNFDDFNTTIAAISPSFASGSDAGTSFKTFLQRLIPTSSSAKDAMAELGLITEDGSNKFFDASGNMKGMAEISEILNQATKGLSEEQKNQAYSTIFGTDSMRAAFGVAESGKVVYTDVATAAKELGVTQEEVNKVIEGGVTQFEALQLQMGLVDANEQAATRMDNFRGKLNILQGVIETVQLSIGQKFLPVLTKLAEWATAFVTANAPAVIAFFEKFAEGLGKAIEALMSGQSPMQAFALFLGTFGEKGQALATTITSIVTAIGGFLGAIGNLLGPIAEAIGKFVTWKDVLIVLGAAVAAVVIPAIIGMIAAIAPVIAIIGGAILAVAALRNAWEGDWLGIRTATTAALDYMTKALEPFTSAVAKHMSGALQEVKDFVTGNETEWTHVKAIWNGAKQSGQTLFDDLKSFVTDGLPVWRERLTEWGTAAAKWITEAIPVVIAEMSKWLDATVNFLADTLPRWIEQLTAWGNELWAWIAPALTDTITALGAWVTGIINYIVDQLPRWRSEMLKWATALVEWVSSSAADAIPELGRWLGKVLAWVALGVIQLAAGMIQFAKELVAWISHRDAEPTSELSKWLKLVTDWVAQAVKDFSAKMTAFAKGLIEWITSPEANPDPELDKFKAALLSGIERVKGAFIEGVQEFAQAWWDTIKEYVDWNQVGQDVINQVRDGVDAVKETIYQKITMIVESAKKLFDLDSWLALGAKVLNKVTDGIASVASSFYTKITSIATEGAARFLEYDWSQIGTDIIQGVIDGLDGMKQAILDKIGEIAGALPDWMKELLGIASPSKVFAQIGRDMMLGLVVGIQDNARRVTDALGGVTDSVIGLVRQISGGSQVRSAINSLTGIYSDLADLLGNADMQKAVGWMKGDNAKTNILADILDFAKQAGINPKQILPTDLQRSGGIDNILKQLGSPLWQAIDTLQQKQLWELEQDRRKAINEFATKPLLDTVATGDNILEHILGGSLSDFSRARIQPLVDQFNNLSDSIAAIANNNRTNTSQSYLSQIQKLIDQRAQILSQINSIAAVSSYPYADTEANIAILQKQIELLQKAKSLGMTGINSAAYGPYSDPKTLAALVVLEQRMRTDTEANLLNQIRQMQIDQQLEKLPTVGSYSGTGSDFVSRYQQTVLDPMLETMRKLSTTDEQRAALITRYRQESEKILQLQQKQQQLDYLNQQLSMVQQITKLNEDFDDLVSVQDILAGITFGVNASIDDMLLLTSRTIDAMIATVKKQLGIASPSKVFAQIGSQIMAGLAQGVSQPLSSLMGPRSSQPYSVSNNRSLAINMGGVTVANGMDEVMFEAFIHRTVEGMLFA